MRWGIAHSHQRKYEMFKMNIFHLVPAPGPQPGPVWQPDEEHKGVPLVEMELAQPLGHSIPCQGLGSADPPQGMTRGHFQSTGIPRAAPGLSLEMILRGKMKAEPSWAGDEAVLVCGFEMFGMNTALATRFPINKSTSLVWIKITWKNRVNLFLLAKIYGWNNLYLQEQWDHFPSWAQKGKKCINVCWFLGQRTENYFSAEIF